MRGPDYNVPEDIASRFDAATSLKIFEGMSLVRYFELGLMDAVKEKRVAYNVYLSTGQEAIAAALSLKVRDYMIFAQHRAHDIYLTFGGDPSKLRDELLGLPSGTSRGRAGSNCLQYHQDGISMYGHHGLIGENVPQAVGAALATAGNTVTIFGDGAAEEDYVLSA
ncbi:MAG: thiamine pyrophosphate-dependent enzyme, partial [Planctomycetota bacterium]